MYKTRFDSLSPFEAIIFRGVLNFLADSSNYDSDGSNGLNPEKLFDYMLDSQEEQFEDFATNVKLMLDREWNLRFGTNVNPRFK